MSRMFQTIDDFQANLDLIARKPYGVIETRNGDFYSLTFKPWPKIISATEAAWAGAFRRQRIVQDRCRLFYNQPMRYQNFLALKYIESTLSTTLATFRRAAQILDEVAQAKKTDAILAHVTNSRISDRLLERWGWERHLESRSGRHYIKRFYGEYPPSIFAESEATGISDFEDAVASVLNAS